MSLVTKAFKLMVSLTDENRDNDLKTPNDIIRFNDLIYGTDPIFQSLDVYTPADKVDQFLPTIISVHGGGFVYGTKEGYQFYCMNLAQKGFKVVNFSYRLAPENKFPSQLEDTNEVFKWVLNNAEEYHFDLNNLFAVSDSAGASLLGVYAGILTNSEINKINGFNFDLPALNLKAIALNCGLYNPRKQNPLKDATLTRNCMKDLFVFKGNKKELELINVANYINKNYPPSFIVTAEKDFLREQPEYLIPELMKKEVPFIFRYFSSKEKELEHVFHLNIRSEDARVCNDEECNFFKEFIS